MEEMLKKILDQMNSHFSKIDKRFEQIDKRFDCIDKRFEQVDERFEQIDERFDRIDKRFERVDKRFTGIDSRLDNMTLELKQIKVQQQENTNVLRALEHKADVHKAEIDKLANEVAQVSGNQKNILDNLEELKTDVNLITVTTSKNTMDIARMKAIR